MITIGSLFAGIGGLELGLEAALSEAGIPHRIAWQVERDGFCRSVLAKHWPDVDRSVEDVTRATAANLVRVDWMVGGFPCQDVSSAGRGAGLDGERSGLWHEYARLVRELRPSVVIVENVASGKRRYLCRVRRDLHDAGYRTTAYQLGAHDVGAPHRRERIFVVAHADGCGEGLSEREPTGRVEARAGAGGARREAAETLADSAPCGSEGRHERAESAGWNAAQREALAHTDGERKHQPRGKREEQRGWPADLGAARDGRDVGDSSGPRRSGAEHESGSAFGGLPAGAGGERRPAERGVGGGAHGLPVGLDRRLPERWPAGRGAAQEPWEPPRTVSQRDPRRRARLRALGNAVVPAQARAIGRLILGGAA